MTHADIGIQFADFTTAMLAGKLTDKVVYRFGRSQGWSEAETKAFMVAYTKRLYDLAKNPKRLGKDSIIEI